MAQVDTESRLVIESYGHLHLTEAEKLRLTNMYEQKMRLAAERGSTIYSAQNPVTSRSATLNRSFEIGSPNVMKSYRR